MSAKQRLRVGKRGTVDGQLDWLVEWGEPTEIVGGRRRRVAKRVRLPKQHGGDGHREREDQQDSGVDHKSR